MFLSFAASTQCKCEALPQNREQVTFYAMQNEFVDIIVKEDNFSCNLNQNQVHTLSYFLRYNYLCMRP